MTPAALALLLALGAAPPGAAPPAPAGFTATPLAHGEGYALARYERSGTDPVVAFALAADPARRRLAIAAFDRLLSHREILARHPALALLNGGFHMAHGTRAVALGAARGPEGASPSEARRFPHLAVDGRGRPSISDDTARLARRDLAVLQSKPRLLYGGKISPRTADPAVTRPVRQPRSAIALTGEGGALLVVVEGRSAASGGMTLLEFARFLRDLGGRDALAMDGGGSALLVVNGEPVNTPSGGLDPFTLPGKARPMLNAILVE